MQSELPGQLFLSILAIKQGYSAIALLLVSHGADVNILNEEGESPSDLAVRLQHRDIIEQIKNTTANATGSK